MLIGVYLHDHNNEVGEVMLRPRLGADITDISDMDLPFSLEQTRPRHAVSSKHA
jgi:hypothetical protein